MKIENNILAITNCLFKDKHNWQFVSPEQKEQFFFPINRLLSRRYPQLAHLLNNKFSDKASALDCWFYFMMDKPYPSWMWKKNQKQQKEQVFQEVAREHDINAKDLPLLKVLAHEQLIEEEKYLNKNK